MRLRLVLTAVATAAALLAGGDHAAAGGGGCRETAPTVSTAATSVAMDDFCFEPGVVTITPGETLEITNEDPVLHNVYGPGWFHGEVAPGESLSRTFDDVGTYTFACTLHPGMTGAVVVSDLEPIAATSPLPADDGGGDRMDVLAGIGLALLTGIASGWTLGWVAHRRDQTA